MEELYIGPFDQDRQSTVLPASLRGLLLSNTGVEHPRAEEAPTSGWPEQSLCTQVDPDVFFAGKGESSLTYLAKKLCQSCEAYSPCKQDTLSTDLTLAEDQIIGTRGGMSGNERKKARRQTLRLNDQ